MSFKTVSIIAGAMCTSACATAGMPLGTEDLGLGEAVKYNAAIQTINPTPVYAPGSVLPGDNGEKAADAVVRYRNDLVNDRHDKAAKTLSTTKSVTSSSSGPQ